MEGKERLEREEDNYRMYLMCYELHNLIASGKRHEWSRIIGESKAREKNNKKIIECLLLILLRY